MNEEIFPKWIFYAWIWIWSGIKCYDEMNDDIGTTIKTEQGGHKAVRL